MFLIAEKIPPRHALREDISVITARLDAAKIVKKFFHTERKQKRKIDRGEIEKISKFFFRRAQRQTAHIVSAQKAHYFYEIRFHSDFLHTFRRGCHTAMRLHHQVGFVLFEPGLRNGS